MNPRKIFYNMPTYCKIVTLIVINITMSTKHIIEIMKFENPPTITNNIPANENAAVTVHFCNYDQK